MTLKELSQLYHLNREIEIDQKRLEELKILAESTSAPLSDIPRNPNIESRLERYVAEIIDLTEAIFDKQIRCLRERNRLERHISSIDDSLTRQIFTLRFISGFSWAQVAAHIGEVTENRVKLVCNRFLKQKR